ncbi:MAG: hypothetical protein L0Y58_07665 [Verrucomicrobia subdivision 3 bacterium]|nr:hypothetical protein [Limisphaerales bacterium]
MNSVAGNEVRVLVLALLLAGGCSKSPDEKWASPESKYPTFTSLDKPSPKNQELLPVEVVKLENADIDTVLNLYQRLSGRTVIRSPNLPKATVTLAPANPVNVLKALQMLDTALAQNQITMIPQGSDVIKAVPQSAAGTEAVPACQLKPEELPESSSYTHYVVRLRHLKPRDVAQALQPFAKCPNSILGIDSASTIILRDYAVNVRRMLQVLEDLENKAEPLGNGPKASFSSRLDGMNGANTNAPRARTR